MHQVAVVGRAGRDRAQVLGHRVRVALQTGDAHRAEAERRAARQLDLETRLARLRDRSRRGCRRRAPRRSASSPARARASRFAASQSAWRNGSPRRRRQLSRTSLNRYCASRSWVAGPLKRISTSATRVRGPGSTFSVTFHSGARLVDARFHLRREVALGRGRLARLAFRVLDQPAQLLGVHLRVVLPAREIQALAQRAGELARRLHLEAVAQALRVQRLAPEAMPATPLPRARPLDSGHRVCSNPRG